MKERPKKVWTLPWEEVTKALDASLKEGLSSAEAKKRTKLYGPNRLREVEAQSAWLILFNQIKNLIIVFLLAASGLSFAFGEVVEGVAIAAVIVINTAIGFVTELKGARSIEALRKLGDVVSRVRRNGAVQEIPATGLVPGDLVMIEGGDIVTADLRIVSASRLQADESVLTGESVPVGKAVDPLAEDTPLAERTNMLFKGTVVTRGSGEAVVVGTGMDTELGEISSLVEKTEDEITPLEKRLNQLGHRLIWLCLIIAALVAVVGIAVGKETFLMIETAIALAVAAIPEGLPIVATIALARGVWRMARRHALIKRLSAVETLGATRVIFTDKTGTLTENRMTVTRLALASGEIELETLSGGREKLLAAKGPLPDASDKKILVEALEISALCNNASLDGKATDGATKATGDPLEVALLVAAEEQGIHRKELVEEMPEVREEAFDSESKMMATFHSKGESYRVAVKGAPESVLAACSTVLTDDGEQEMSEESRNRWLAKNVELAAEGLRVLALAAKWVDRLDQKPYENLGFVGLVGLLDPPRIDVKGALELCRKAGIRVIMVTGDQAVTARNIALAVGLVDEGEAKVIEGKDFASAEDLSEEGRRELLGASLFARVSPKQKLDLIAVHQQDGSIVAMTGDGVNDAPALKKADIGIAMGQRGTQVAREASDMILTDDAFPSIVHAVEQGRIIFGNIRKFVLYLLSCNISEIMSVTLASVVNAPLPILPLQILFLNVVTDVFPALALAAGEGAPGMMEKPPRDSKEPIMTSSNWLAVIGYGTLITISILGALALALFWLNMEQSRAVTVSFLTLAFAQLWHVFNMGDSDLGFLRNEITRNRFVWGALTLCSALLLMTVYVPGFSHVMKVTNPGIAGWTLVITMSILPVVIGWICRLFTSKGTTRP
ncbi:MAG: cation-translocating P-type ATPase [Deltaproteobacteria bacterium]